MTDKMTHYENAIAAVRTAYQIDAELVRYEAKSHLAQALSFLTSWNQIEAAHELDYILAQYRAIVRQYNINKHS